MSTGLTLRKKNTKKPKISAPQLQSTTNTKAVSNGTTLAPPRERGQASETADLVKRRYSTRFNQLPDFSGNAPPVPSLPGAAALKRHSLARGGSPTRPRTSESSQPLRVEINDFGDANLNAEQYITERLANASESDIQRYQANLQRHKANTATDLQRNIYQNRTQFIKISKEVQRLKSEMVTLRGLMSELTGALGQASGSSINLAEETSYSRRRANRSSVANLESMWNVQLQALWKNIERSQKFLPAIPGRHIIMETGHWVELDSATWKPKRPVHIVLLNDHLLMASKKRKRIDPNTPQKGPAPTKLVAEECWPLAEIDLIDLGANLGNEVNGMTDERNIGTAISVRAGNRSWTYRHDSREQSAKGDLLITFRKAAEDLRKATVVDAQKQGTLKDTLNYFVASDPASVSKTEIVDSIIPPKERPEVLFDVDGKQQSMRWIEGQIDDLDIEIALQHFEEAIGRVESLRKLARGLRGNAIAQDLVNVKVDERAARLAVSLTRYLVDTPSHLEATKQNTGWLVRLGYEDNAREAFLSSRSETLAKRSRQCVFEGDLHNYIFQISYVYFTLVKNTASIYQACFPALMMSACVKWAKEHLETYNALLVRQLSSVEKDGMAWRECMDVVWQMEGMLGEVGLDFRELVGRRLEVRDAKRAEPQADSANDTSTPRSGTPSR